MAHIPFIRRLYLRAIIIRIQLEISKFTPRDCLRFPTLNSSSCYLKAGCALDMVD